MATLPARCIVTRSSGEVLKRRSCFIGIHFPHANRCAFRYYASAPTPENDDVPAALEEGGAVGWLDAAVTLTQLWALVLPLGYAGVPLAAHALRNVPSGSALAAVCVESVVLAAVWGLLRQRHVDLLIDFSDVRGIGVGLAAAAAALAANQFLFGAEHAGSGATGGGAELAAVLATTGPVGVGALLLASSVLAPATEELMYRGFLLGSLRKLDVPAPAAVALSAALFSAAHLQPAGAPQLAIAGVALGAAASAASGNVAASFAGHAAYNAALFCSLLAGAL